MKNLHQWTLLAMLLVAALFLANCGGDDDDNDDSTSDDADDDADDTATDDTGDDADDDIDDDTVQDELTVTNLTAGECSEEKAMPDPTTEPHDMVEVQWDGGVLKVKHYAAILNCCFDLDVTATQSESKVTVTETDVGDPCDCYCSSDVEYQIEGALPGDYRFTLNGMLEGKATGTELSRFDASLDDGLNWEWGIPTVDMIAVQGEGPFSGGDTVTVRVSPCYVEDSSTIQINYREGYGGQDDGFGIYFMVYDRRSLDDPGDPDGTCYMENVDITAPSTAGSYNLRANTYMFVDPIGWDLYTAPLTLDVE